MARSLQDIYESARLNVPAEGFPARHTVAPWEELDAQVHYELEVLKNTILSVLADDSHLLASHKRVIGHFNRGLRTGFFDGGGAEPSLGEESVARQQPFQWGVLIGRRASASDDALSIGEQPQIFTQFITVTHLLAYEFAQLEQAHAGPFEFVRRAVGPKRVHEYGELVFALPVLLNYRADLVRELLEEGGFDFDGYYATLPAAPSHLEYLEHGLIALFDPVPERWIDVAASMGLAIEDFHDGTGLLDEDHNAPVQAAMTIASKPITAHALIQQQVRRIELAREWVGASEVRIAPEDETRGETMLWDVFGLTPFATVRGGEHRKGDLVAHHVVRALAEHFQRVADGNRTWFAFLRRRLPAFAKGFDERFEAAVGAGTFESARTGAQVAAGLSRFERGQEYVDAVLDMLYAVDKTIRDLEHAAERPADFVGQRLAANTETPVAKALLELLRERPRLATELFQERPEFDFFSKTTVQTASPYDLMRSALFFAARAQTPGLAYDDEREAHRAEALRRLERLISDAARPPAAVARTAKPQPYNVVLTRDTGKSNLDDSLPLVERAQLFQHEFESLNRLLKSIIVPLHVAYRLNRRTRVNDPSAHDRGHRVVSIIS